MKKILQKHIGSCIGSYYVRVSGRGKTSGYYTDVEAMAPDTTHIEGLEDNCVVESVASTNSNG